MSGKPPISTHILDTTRGQPAVGVDVIKKKITVLFCSVLFEVSRNFIRILIAFEQVALFKLVDGNWVLINDSVTNSDGRCAEFLQREAFRSGRYKLHFAVEKYFKSIRSSTIYPFIEVCYEFHQFFSNIFNQKNDVHYLKLGTMCQHLFIQYISREIIQNIHIHSTNKISSCNLI